MTKPKLSTVEPASAPQTIEKPDPKRSLEKFKVQACSHYRQRGDITDGVTYPADLPGEGFRPVTP